MTNPTSKNKTQPIDAPTGLAIERTLLAWVRTGIALMGFGFVVARFGLFLKEVTEIEHLPPRATGGISFWFGGGLMIFGVCVLIIAGFHHAALVRKLSAGEPYQIAKFSFVVMLTFLLAAFGSAMTGYLLYLIR